MPKVYNRFRGAPRDVVRIDRGTPYGNPFVIGEHGTRKEVIERFKCEVLPTLDLEPLIGRDLLCCCWPKPCHGDVLIEEVERRYGRHEPD